MVISRPLCAVQHAQDHDGLLEFGEVQDEQSRCYFDASRVGTPRPKGRGSRCSGMDIEPLRNKAAAESNDIDSPVRWSRRFCSVFV